MLAQVTRNPSSAHARTAQIDRATSGLSSRTERQARTLEKASVTLGHKIATASRASAGTVGASLKAASAKARADTTSTVVMNPVGAMSRIADRSAGIAEAATLARCLVSFRLDQADQTGMTRVRRAG